MTQRVLVDFGIRGKHWLLAEVPSSSDDSRLQEFRHGTTGRYFHFAGDRLRAKNRTRKDMLLETLRTPYATFELRREFGSLFLYKSGTEEPHYVTSQREAHLEVALFIQEKQTEAARRNAVHGAQEIIAWDTYTLVE